MLNNFIYAQSKAMFEERLHKVPNDAIVFIEDTKEIWTHGHYFDGSTLDPSIIPNLQMEVAELQANVNNKADKAATVEKEIVGELEMVHAHGISNDAYAYALPDTANGDEDDVLLSQQSVKTINGEVIYGSGDISTFHYGVCNSAETTALKEVTVSTLTNIVNGTKLVIKFTNAATTPIASLKINGGDAQQVKWKLNTPPQNTFGAGTVLEFTFADDVWHITGGYQYEPYVNGLKGSNGYVNITNYGVCNTAADAADKTVTVSGNFSLVTGAQVVVKFTNGNTVNTSTLNVNDTGSKTIEWGSYSGARYMNGGEILTFVYDGTNWYCKSSSAALTSGNVNTGYFLQTINNNRCGLAISAGSSVTSSADGALYINKGTGSGNNAICCNGGNIVAHNGFFDGAYVYNTRVLTESAILNKTDSLVLCNAASSATITLPSDPIDGQIITFIKPVNGTVIFSSSISNLNAPQDGTLNSKTITITSVGVRKLYYINSRWYIFLQ